MNAWAAWKAQPEPANIPALLAEHPEINFLEFCIWLQKEDTYQALIKDLKHGRNGSN